MHLKWYPARTFCFLRKGYGRISRGETIDIRKPLGVTSWESLCKFPCNSGTRQTLKPCLWFFFPCPSVYANIYIYISPGDSFYIPLGIWVILLLLCGTRLLLALNTITSFSIESPGIRLAADLATWERVSWNTDLCSDSYPPPWEGEKTKWKNLCKSQEWTDGGFWERFPHNSLQKYSAASPDWLQGSSCTAGSELLQGCKTAGWISLSLPPSPPPHVCVSIWLTTAVHIFGFF